MTRPSGLFAYRSLFLALAPSGYRAALRPYRPLLSGEMLKALGRVVSGYLCRSGRLRVGAICEKEAGTVIVG